MELIAKEIKTNNNDTILLDAILKTALLATVKSILFLFDLVIFMFSFFKINEN